MFSRSTSVLASLAERLPPVFVLIVARKLPARHSLNVGILPARESPLLLTDSLKIRVLWMLGIGQVIVQFIDQLSLLRQSRLCALDIAGIQTY